MCSFKNGAVLIREFQNDVTQESGGPAGGPRGGKRLARSTKVSTRNGMLLSFTKPHNGKNRHRSAVIRIDQVAKRKKGANS